jgi:Cu/Ag efflux protein CusF
MDSRRRSRGGPARAIALSLFFIVWSAGSAAAGPSFDGQGRVTGVDAERSTVTIQHGGIPGLLPATRTAFPVQSADVLRGVHTGDRVRFTLGAADESHGLLAVTSLATDGAWSAGALDRIAASVTMVLALLTLAAVAAVGILLWRELQSLRRQVIALDHDAGTLRGLVADTQDGVREIARALEEAATALRVGYVQELRRRFVPTSSTGATEVADDKRSGDGAGALVVVQRGRGELYRAVEGGAAGPGLAVIWDRRRGERRRGARRAVSHERRSSERRGSPPETWTRLGFHLVAGGITEIARTPRVLRPASGERGAPR